MSVSQCVKVIINNPSRQVDKSFYYIANGALIGDHVLVPFGKGNKLTDGVVIGVGEAEYTDKLKTVYSVKGKILDENRISLLSWLREKYVCTYYDCLRVILPPGAMTAKNGAYEGFGNKKINFAYFTADEETFDSEMSVLELKAPAQARVMDILSQVKEMPVVYLTEMAQTTAATVKALEKKGFLKTEAKAVERNPFKEKTYEKKSDLKPNAQQKEVIDYTTAAMKENRYEGILLRGVTGSGKTEVYLQAVREAINMGKRAIILVPEISLTPQMSQRFLSRFGERVAIFHSGLSMGERFDAWDKINKNEIDVVVGARSAVFMPVDNIGIIVVDEEHEASYKSDMSPKYDAREVAEFICRRNNAILMLASATPSVKSAYKALNGEYTLKQMKNRYNSVNLPQVDIVDMRLELSKGNRSFFSFRLQDEIEKNLRNKEQTILFLNRRGFATFVSCRACGYAAKCPDCNIALTYHKYDNNLVCHYCGYTIKNYTTCPSCNSKFIKQFGVGTEKVEEEIKNLFPQATTLRMDVDTTRGKMSHQKILEKFENEKIDILVGTQMITKGLDFPNVSLVGVLAADMMLYSDDYQAGEKTFQLITQVCGRAGRGEKQGRAIVQTYSPLHRIITCSKNQDYGEFYKNEIAVRKKIQYPPFSDIINIIVSGENVRNVREMICSISDKTKEMLSEEKVYFSFAGPNPAPISKISGRYRWRLLLKCESNEKVRAILRHTVVNAKKTDDDITVTLDINPNSVL